LSVYFLKQQKNGQTTGCTTMTNTLSGQDYMILDGSPQIYLIWMKS